MNPPEKARASVQYPPLQEARPMHACQFEYQVDASRTVTFEPAAVAPVGPAQIILLSPDAPVHQAHKAQHVAADVERFGKQS